MRSILLTLMLALAGCAPRVPDITISDAWARATAAGQSSGSLYATIVNTGAADRLTKVSSRAGMAMLHTNDSQGGVARMRMLADLPVPARSEVELAPGGTHIMLTGLKAPLTVGMRVPLTLAFATSGERTVEVVVVAAGTR